MAAEVAFALAGARLAISDDSGSEAMRFPETGGGLRGTDRLAAQPGMPGSERNRGRALIVQKLDPRPSDVAPLRRNGHVWVLGLLLLPACQGCSVDVAPVAIERSAAPDPRIVAAAWANALLEGSPEALLEWMRPVAAEP